MGRLLSSHVLNRLFSSDHSFQSVEFTFMELDLSINIVVLGLRFSHQTVMRPSSHILNRLSFLDILLPCHWSFSSGRSSHLNLLLIDRVSILIYLLRSRLSLLLRRMHQMRDLHLHLHLRLLPHLLPMLSVSSPLGNTEFAHEAGQNGGSNDHPPSEHVIVLFPLVSSLLTLFFS